MSQRACATGCGQQARVDAYFCEACGNAWAVSPEHWRLIDTTPDVAEAIRTTALADFARRVRAERENGARP